MSKPHAAFSIRPLQTDDLGAISRVHWHASRIAYRFMNWSYSEDEVHDWYAGKLHEWDWGRVVCEGGTVVGFIAAHRAHVDQIFVDPDHQGAGLGSALMTAFLDRGLRPATLHVFARNVPTRALYERYGFREVDAWWNERDGAVELLYRLEWPHF